MIKKVKTSLLKNNPNNPRVIKDDQFRKLCKSIKDFPEMLEARPIVVNPDMVVLGGNMRLKALLENGIKEVNVYVASWDEVKEKEFMIKDNANFGEWDWQALDDNYDHVSLSEWGIEAFSEIEQVDLSALQSSSYNGQLEKMEKGVRKAIQIEFTEEDYQEASALVSYFRKKGANLGTIIIDHLNNIKDQL